MPRQIIYGMAERILYSSFKESVGDGVAQNQWTFISKHDLSHFFLKKTAARGLKAVVVFCKVVSWNVYDVGKRKQACFGKINFLNSSLFRYWQKIEEVRRS